MKRLNKIKQLKRAYNTTGILYFIVMMVLFSIAMYQENKTFTILLGVGQGLMVVFIILKEILESIEGMSDIEYTDEPI
jgi:hypothetical protein